MSNDNNGNFYLAKNVSPCIICEEIHGFRLGCVNIVYRWSTIKPFFSILMPKLFSRIEEENSNEDSFYTIPVHLVCKLLR